MWLLNYIILVKLKYTYYTILNIKNINIQIFIKFNTKQRIQKSNS